MTREQEIQTALKAAFLAALETAGITNTKVYAIKLDNAEDNDEDAESYPVIVINTSTPVPQGHKSYILEFPCWIQVQIFSADDKKREEFSFLSEIVFNVLDGVDDWTEYEVEDAAQEINAVMINSSEEPATDGVILIQTTNCTIHANKNS